MGVAGYSTGSGTDVHFVKMVLLKFLKLCNLGHTVRGLQPVLPGLVKDRHRRQQLREGTILVAKQELYQCSSHLA